MAKEAMMTNATPDVIFLWSGIRLHGTRLLGGAHGAHLTVIPGIDEGRGTSILSIMRTQPMMRSAIIAGIVFFCISSLLLDFGAGSLKGQIEFCVQVLLELVQILHVSTFF